MTPEEMQELARAIEQVPGLKGIDFRDVRRLAGGDHHLDRGHAAPAVGAHHQALGDDATSGFDSRGEGS